MLEEAVAYMIREREEILGAFSRRLLPPVDFDDEEVVAFLDRALCVVKAGGGMASQMVFGTL